MPAPNFVPPVSVTLTLPNGQLKTVFNVRYYGSSDFGDYYTANDLDGKAYSWAILAGSYDVERYREGSLSGFTGTPLSLVLPTGQAITLYNVTADGFSDFGDYYTGQDSNGNPYRWAVLPGSTNLGAYREGSLSGYTASNVAALAPQQTPSRPADTSAAALTRPVASDPLHIYVSTTDGRDNWKQIWGGGTYTWQTPVGQTSAAIIQGTYQFTPDASASVPAIVNTTRTGVTDVPASTSTATGDASNQVTGGNQGGGGPNGGTVSQTVVAVPPADAGPRSSTSHVYVGRDTRGDVWQLFDGNRVLEWAVMVGDASAAIIEGSLRDLGSPSSGTVAQRPTTPQANSATPPATPAATPLTPEVVADAKGKLFLTVAAVLAKALIFN